MSEFEYNLDLLLRKGEAKRLTSEDKTALITMLAIERIRRNSRGVAHPSTRQHSRDRAHE
jgi:hypothetical protein